MEPTILKTTDPHSKDDGPEPDVSWGQGGIDDWGWTRHESDRTPDAALTPSSSPRKEK